MNKQHNLPIRIATPKATVIGTVDEDVIREKGLMARGGKKHGISTMESNGRSHADARGDGSPIQPIREAWGW